MCEYCKPSTKMKIHGKYFKFEKTYGYKEDYIKYSSWIMQGNADKKAGIFVAEYGNNGCYFDINFCPMCGRKLGEENAKN